MEQIVKIEVNFESSIPTVSGRELHAALNIGTEYAKWFDRMTEYGFSEQEDDGEPFDEKMKRLTSELSEMFSRSHELEDEIREKLGAIGYDI